MEWRAKAEDLKGNNQTLIYSYPTEVYTRFGDVVIQPNQLQVKLQDHNSLLSKALQPIDGITLLLYIMAVLLYGILTESDNDKCIISFF